MNKPEVPTWVHTDAARAFGYTVDFSNMPERLNGGFQHEVWRVPTTTGLGELAVKFQRSEPTLLSAELEEVAEEAAVGVAGMVYTEDGEYWHECQTSNGSPAYLTARYFLDADGFGRDFVSPGFGFQVGRELALLHNASQRAFAYKIDELIEHNRASVDEEIHVEHTLLSSSVINTVSAFINNIDYAERDAIIGHRDIGPRNILRDRQTNQLYIIDFDEAGLTTRDGELIDAAFNIAGVHTPNGPARSVVEAVISGYKTKSEYPVEFDETSFHMLIGMSEWWWLNECIRRRDSRAGDISRERSEISRLLYQIPRDIKSIPTWLDWVATVNHQQ